ncbi:MAG: hemerythrin domain-containing protein [Candidatus Abyssobacteria bacterium SURF_5]|jgi:hemerythrin-like domain-containing protein|uniref:Hemerythrin domain-containing protein n=1 Tax=Abyssobacteria bacterium (strain SURF_5) TaxID=2093360 RepID=A0A3A4NW65_ABYX5|nr:MAG: hemerythrin domain-containing protein [Candidatus Abyssubacteria bacterium SURF_5]
MPQADLFMEIHSDHEQVQGILEKLVQTSKGGRKNRENLFEKLKIDLIPHMKAEEKVFYPVLAKEKRAREDALEALEEHHVAEMVLKELDKMPKDQDEWKAKLLVFKELIRKHIEEEESKIFDDARKAFDQEQISDIFEEFQKNKQSLKNRLSKKAAA